MVKKSCIFLMVLSIFIFVPMVVGDVRPETRSTMSGGPDGTTHFKAGAPDTSWDGETTKTTEDVLTKLERSGVNYPVGKTEIIFKNDSGDVLNPSIENLVSLIDRNQHKVVYDVSNVPLATGPITIYIEKFEGFNAIHICEGADELPKVGPGVCAALGGIPITIFPGGDTKGYTVTSYYDSSIGRDFWKVEGLTGTGLQLFNVLFGGAGGPDFIGEGESIDLDEEISKEYVSKEKIEYYVIVDDISYLVTVDYVHSESEYASFYVESMGKSFVLYEGDVENFDFNLDGEIDATLDVENIDYPHVYAELSLFQPTGKFEFVPREKEVAEKGGVYSGKGGIWSRFIEIAEGSWWQVLLMFGLLVLVVAFFGLMGWKLISKIWRAT